MIISIVQVLQEWWKEWQLRAVVLFSLIIQYILVSFSPLNRKFHLPLWFKLHIQIAYIASEAVPINALATLLDRQKKSSQSPSVVHGNRDLELLWAPILLMHLSGSNAVPIQNMEENEQWTKHLGVAVSQVSVALYVFYLSWPSSSADKRQLAAAILLFIPGILKCFVKPWSVKSASFSSLQEASRSPGPGVRQNRQVSSSIEETEAYVQAARDFVLNLDHPPLGDEQIHYSLSERLEPLFRALCVDRTYPHADRLAILKSFWSLDAEGDHSAVGSGLSHIYNRFYTKHDKASRYSQILNVALPLAAICLFHVSLHGASSSSSHYSPQDVKVTYALFYGTLALEIFSLSYWFMSIQSGWQMVPQLNLIALLSSHRRHPVSLRMLRFLGFEKYLYYMRPISSSRDMNKIVCHYLRDGWLHWIKDAESYSRFNDSYGELTLEREGCLASLQHWISGSRPFDERVLIWHLATDQCFHLSEVRMETTTPASHNKHAALSLGISNYMVHLLFTNPEMLMVGSRKEIFMVAYQELKELGLFQQHRDDLRVMIYSARNAESSEQGFLWDACELVNKLEKINDQDRLWSVIQGVWVEMLCFSAGRCRGYLHAKNIGVEYLSQVWILLAYAGMETLPERLQRTSKFQGSLQQEETTEAQDGGIAPPSTSLQGEGTAASDIKIVVSP